MAKPLVFEINHKRIKVIETSSPGEVLDVLNKFVDNLSSMPTKVIGFESIARFADDALRKPIIALCDGELCLVCPISHLPQKTLIYLDNFLRLPHVSFVGSGIKADLQLLEKEYGVYCRNAVELGPLASLMVQFPTSPGLNINLASTWRAPLTHNERIHIASTACSYFDIGYSKFSHIGPSSMHGSRYFKLSGQLM